MIAFELPSDKRGPKGGTLTHQSGSKKVSESPKKTTCLNTKMWKQVCGTGQWARWGVGQQRFWHPEGEDERREQSLKVKERSCFDKWGEVVKTTRRVDACWCLRFEMTAAYAAQYDGSDLLKCFYACPLPVMDKLSWRHMCWAKVCGDLWRDNFLCQIYSVPPNDTAKR